MTRNRIIVVELDALERKIAALERRLLALEIWRRQKEGTSEALPPDEITRMLERTRARQKAEEERAIEDRALEQPQRIRAEKRQRRQELKRERETNLARQKENELWK